MIQDIISKIKIEAIIDYLNHTEVPINTLEEINKLLIKKVVVK